MLFASRRAMTVNVGGVGPLPGGAGVDRLHHLAHRSLAPTPDLVHHLPLELVEPWWDARGLLGMRRLGSHAASPEMSMSSAGSGVASEMTVEAGALVGGLGRSPRITSPSSRHRAAERR